MSVVNGRACHTVLVSVRDFALLAVGAVLGVLAQQSYDWIIGNYRRHAVARRTNRFRSHDAFSSLYVQTMQFYQRRDLISSLYVSNVGTGGPIPLLASTLIIPRTLGFYRDNILLLEDGKDVFPARERLINQATRAGATIFDGEILHITDIETEGESIVHVGLKRCNYFAYASLSMRLQGALRARWRGKSLHEQHLSTFQAAVLQPLQPQVLGCVCATLFEEDGEILIAIAHRSPEVFNSSNARGLLPNFGAESNAAGRQRSRYSLLFYNFLREFAEEFHDLDDLTEMLKARRAHPDWIMSLSVIENVLHEAATGRLTMEHLGVAINPTDGALLCAILAWFHSPPFYRELRENLPANWESSNDERGNFAIQFVPLFDPLIDEWADNNEISPSSIFAIDLARKRVKDRDVISR